MSMISILFFVAFVASLGLIFRSPFYGVIIWYVFSLGNPHRIGEGVLATLPYGYVIAILTILMWLASREPKKIPVTPLLALTFAFSVWMTISSITAAAPADAVWQQWTNIHKMLLMAVIGFAMSNSRTRINGVVWTVVAAIGFWGICGGASALMNGGEVQIYGPAGTAIGDNNDLGLALVMILPLISYQWQLAKNVYAQWGLLVMELLTVVAIFFTYSRGALIGLCAMGVVFWWRTRWKLSVGAIIICAGVFVYNFAPQSWFERMTSIETYDSDESAMLRIHFWQIALQIAAEQPLVGGGFRVTYFPDVTGKFLAGTNIENITKPRAVHSIYFETLAEHGYVGLGLFVLIGLRSLANVLWLVRNSRGRPDLLWANLLGRMGLSSLVGFWVAGIFLSLEYYDGYWCAVFLFDAARLQLAKELAATKRQRQARASATVPILVPLAASQSGLPRQQSAPVHGL